MTDQIANQTSENSGIDRDTVDDLLSILAAASENNTN